MVGKSDTAPIIKRRPTLSSRTDEKPQGLAVTWVVSLTDTVVHFAALRTSSFPSKLPTARVWDGLLCDGMYWRRRGLWHRAFSDVVSAICPRSQCML